MGRSSTRESFRRSQSPLPLHKADCMVRYKSDKGCSTTSYVSSLKASTWQAQYCPMIPFSLPWQSVEDQGEDTYPASDVSSDKTRFVSPLTPRSSKTIPAHQSRSGRTTVQVEAPLATRVQRPSEFAEMHHRLTQAEQRSTVRRLRCISVALLSPKCALQIIWLASSSKYPLAKTSLVCSQSLFKHQAAKLAHV